jgi:hypothetical protein
VLLPPASSLDQTKSIIGPNSNLLNRTLVSVESVAVRPLDHYPPVLVPILVFLTCVTAGVVTAARRLPDLGEGTIGGLAFLVVCCLLGAALGIVGLRIYWIAHMLGDTGGSLKAEIVTEGLSTMLWEAGSILGIAAAVYLLAPSAEPASPTADIGA